jgi:cell division ATPase FtsA
VFYEGILKHTAVIPFAGENITNDIKTGLGVLKQQAEQMKVQFGSALANEAKTNAYITIPGLRRHAGQRNLCKKSCKHHPGTHFRDYGLRDLPLKTGRPG